jgi:hypothetical protein
MAVPPLPESGETPTGDRSRGAEADLAHALRLAAEARQWTVVVTLGRELEALRTEASEGRLRVVTGGRAGK